MIDSLLLYLGLVVAAFGVISIVRLRWRGALIATAGLVIAAIALALPIRDKHAARRDTLLDRAMPVWQFDERHSMEIAAPPERVYEAIQRVTADDIFLFRTLVTIRRFGRPGPENILNPSRDTPIIDVATRTTFVVVDEAKGRELVIGTVVAAPRGASGELTRDLFYRKLRPGVALATMNFLVTPAGPGRSHVSTETRVYANSPQTARRFAIYWRIIHPGSDIIRRMWLRAIRNRCMNDTT